MKKLLLALCMYPGIAAHAQLPTLVKDMNPGVGTGFSGLQTEYQGNILLFANDGTTGEELYQFDGTNFSLLYDMNPGAASSTPGGAAPLANKMVVVGTDVYMCLVNSGDTSIYKYNGSSAPTPIHSSVTYSGPRYLTYLNNKLYFTASISPYGAELLVYDPALDDVKLVKDIYTGAASADPTFTLAYKNKLYFVAKTDTTYNELYCYDPAVDTVGMVADIYPGIGSSGIKSSPQIFNDIMYFMAQAVSGSYELYRFDGKTLKKITDFHASMGTATSSDIGFFNNELYFCARNGPLNFCLFKHIPPGGFQAVSFIEPGTQTYPKNFFTYANKLYFSAITNAHGLELWVYDGVNGPSLLADINPGTPDSWASNFFVYKNTLYFSAIENNSGMEMYRLYDPKAGITNVSFTGTITAYPNPVTKDATLSMTLNTAETLQITLTDIQGRDVYTAPAKKYVASTFNITIPMQNLCAGNYFYQVKNANGRLYASGSLAKE